LYITHTLTLIESARVKRIKASQDGETKKRITPKEKRGGLPKKVFEERQHFSSFMEKLSSIRNSGIKKTKGNSDGFQDMGSLLNKLKKEL